MTKWASRFALGLSNSVPGLKIATQDLMVISDIGILFAQTDYCC